MSQQLATQLGWVDRQPSPLKPSPGPVPLGGGERHSGKPWVGLAVGFSVRPMLASWRQPGSGAFESIF